MADHPHILTIACVDCAALNAKRSARVRSPDPHRVIVSPAFDIRGVSVRAVLDAHEAFDAAQRDGAEPCWVQRNADEHPALAILEHGDIDAFLFALTRDVHTGRPLLELLPPALDDTDAERVAALARNPADFDPTSAFAEALTHAPERERHDASSRTRHQWDDGSALVTFDVGVWHHAVHASWLPYADAWWADARGVPARFATLQDGLEARYAQPERLRLAGSARARPSVGCPPHARRKARTIPGREENTTARSRGAA